MNDKIPAKELDDLAPAEVREVDLYQKREKIYTRKIEGFYQKLRLFTGWPLLMGFFFLPWINLDGKQIVLFDLPARQFHILGMTFWPQDFSLLAWLLIIAAWSLFFVTVLAGRVWCGYTCPQTVWTAMFMWAEQFAEGSRNQRMKLDKEPYTLQKFYKKTLKQSLWIGIAFMTGFTFVGYFYGVRELVVDLVSFNADMWGVAFVLFFTVATYGNAGYLREQVCLHMCPYARFQSVMFDRDTLIVSYDTARGEPRGSRKRNAEKDDTKGDCIDCSLCVQVCPTGIDIRNGLQYECITCALCIDACNSVMTKMGYEPGLIRYTSENALEGKPAHILRPRMIGYAIAILVMISAFSYRLAIRTPLELDVIRDRNSLYTTNNDGMLENTYTLKIINMDDDPQIISIEASGLDGIQISGKTSVDIGGQEVLELPLRLVVDPMVVTTPSNDIEFRIATENDEAVATSPSSFLGPRK